MVKSLDGIRHVAPGDCERDEWVTECPDCRALESFEAGAHGETPERALRGRTSRRPALAPKETE